MKQKQMKPYKLKHKPSGLYYQPYKHGVGSLSKRGKIYQTKRHGLSEAFNRELKQPCSTFKVSLWKNTKKGSLYEQLSYWNWSPEKSRPWVMECETLISDWEIEEV